MCPGLDARICFVLDAMAVGLLQCAGTRSGLVKQPEVQEGTNRTLRLTVWVSGRLHQGFGECIRKGPLLNVDGLSFWAYY